MKSALKKIGVIFITYISSSIISGIMTFSIESFIISDKTFVNLLSLLLLAIAFFLLYKPIKTLVLKEEEMPLKSAKITIYVTVVVALFLGVICFFKVNRTFTSDYEKFAQYIQMLNTQCPIKGEDSELSSVELQGNTLVYSYLFYEFREQTIELLKENEQVIKENIIYSLKNDKVMYEQIKSNNIGVNIIYIGNRSNDKIEFIISQKDLN